jgi:transcriptional regulator NrdR family protein
MMKVLKRAGILEEFDAGKIKAVIQRASNESEEFLTESDLSFIVGQVEKGIFEKHQDQVWHKDICFLVLDVLHMAGFSKTAGKYEQYNMSVMREE